MLPVCVSALQLDEQPLEEPEIAHVLRQVLKALVYLHGEHRVHRDIKAANVLLSAEGAVKISDFGVSGQLTGRAPGHTLGMPFAISGCMISLRG